MADNTFTHVCSLRLFLSISSVSPLPSQKKKKATHRETDANARIHQRLYAPLDHLKTGDACSLRRRTVRQRQPVCL